MTERVVIGGGPLTGKTTLARSAFAAVPVRHTDDLIDTHDWSAASATVAEWMAEPGPWVIEGVAAVRALRKALAATDGAPCDRLIWLRDPHQEREPGQESMAKGCETVLAGIVDELTARGVTIEYGPPAP